jgi:predicted acetyltransferase
MHVVRPGPEYLSSYVAALERGWSADNERGLEATREELSRIQSDAAAFLASMEDREAKGPPITLPDGSAAKRLPSFRRWLWDGEFCGSIGLRWQPGTTALPLYCLGHIGYAVVPWKQRLGYAKSALRLILPEAKAVGLPYVEITTDPDNIASARDRSEWRHLDRALHQTAAVRLQAWPALSHHVDIMAPDPSIPWAWT